MAEAGSTKDALTALKAKVLAAKRDNQEVVCALMLEKMAICKHVKWDDGQSILTSKRKTGFLGFLLCINAVVGLTKDLVNAQNPALKYLLTYKMSQDHLELFFSAVRACGGWNNNATTGQFVAAYKQLLMRHNIEGGRGNSTPQDDTEILNSVQDQHELELRQPAADDHDYCDVLNAMELSE
ncbi:Hypothetical predicted protein [Paramuricea clavata]|uniref:Uncharacterized protein n=1 Tax=Paramuricea clavata TaxID=317549 RepID=A0A7D9KJM1_PARCT|nr:Hypothetical predicted protein [Paramuricea clavata]